MTEAEMAALHARCFSTPAPWNEAGFRAVLADPAVFTQVSTGAFAVFRVAAEEAELLTLAVAPDHRRNGVARALLARGERAAAARGAATLFLEVAADNHAAAALYASAGYRDVGRRRGYYRVPGRGRVDAVLLSKPLAGTLA